MHDTARRLCFWTSAGKPPSCFRRQGCAPDLNDKLVVTILHHKPTRLPQTLKKASKLLILIREIKRIVRFSNYHEHTVSQELLVARINSNNEQCSEFLSLPDIDQRPKLLIGCDTFKMKH